MAVKLLIAGLSNSGKTTLLKSLKKAYVLSHDGKSFPFPIPHTNVPTFDGVSQLTSLMTTKIQAYQDSLGDLPDTVVIDTASKIFDTIYDNCNRKYTGFKIYSEIDLEIKLFTDYIQNVLVENGMNVVILSHAIFDGETSTYSLVGKGSFSKRGGFVAEVDYSSFLEAKNNKRYIHHRSTKYPARTLLETAPDSQLVDDFDLQEYINQIADINSSVETFEL